MAINVSLVAEQGEVLGHVFSVDSGTVSILPNFVDDEMKILAVVCSPDDSGGEIYSIPPERASKIDLHRDPSAIEFNASDLVTRLRRRGTYGGYRWKSSDNSMQGQLLFINKPKEAD